MPSRRSVLRAGGVLGAFGLAGCSALADTVVGPPAHTDWLYDPANVVGTERVAYATLDVAELRSVKESLPAPVARDVARAARRVESVDLASVDRLVAQVYGDADAARVGATLLVEGSFDTDAVAREFGVEGTAFTDEGRHRGHRLFGYEPEFLGDVRGVGGSEGPVRLAVGLSPASLVVGGTLHPERRGVAAVRAALDARAGVATRYTDVSTGARDLLDALEGTALVVGFSSPVVRAFGGRIPASRGALRAVVDDVRAGAVGLEPGPAVSVLHVGLTYDPETIASAENVRAALEELEDEDDAVASVTVRQEGRVIVVSSTLASAEVASAYRALWSALDAL